MLKDNRYVVNTTEYSNGTYSALRCTKSERLQHGYRETAFYLSHIYVKTYKICFLIFSISVSNDLFLVRLLRYNYLYLLIPCVMLEVGKLGTCWHFVQSCTS